MKKETAVILSIGIITASLMAYNLSKKKPYLASTIFGSLGAFGLIYSLLIKQEVDDVKIQLGGG